MKTPSCAPAVLVGVLVTCSGPTALAFLSPMSARGASPIIHNGGSAASALKTSSRLPRPAPFHPVPTRRGVPIAAAREDCKSCMEEELLAKERAAGNGGDDQEGIEARRVAFEQVCFCVEIRALRCDTDANSGSA